MRWTWSRKPSASTTSSTALPTAMASGLPPKVVPWLPAVMPRAASAVARQTPSGKPPPMPLAALMMSGATPDHSWANSLPVRPTPVWTSSMMSRRPCSSQSARRPRRHCGGTDADAALALDRLDQDARPSPGRWRPAGPRGRRSGTWSKPSTFGPKPSMYFCWPPAAMVASVRPWKAPSKVMIRKRSGWPSGRVVLARHLDGGLVGLGARIGEEGHVREGRVHEAPAQPLALRDLEQVRGVPELLRLRGQGLDEVRMGVAERVHRDAGAEIEVSLAARAPRAMRPRRARRRWGPGHRSAEGRMSRSRLRVVARAREARPHQMKVPPRNGAARARLLEKCPILSMTDRVHSPDMPAN